MHFNYFSPPCLSTTASSTLITRLRKRSLRIWHWQMSNYRRYIHVSRLWPARPAISPIDAECETWALSLSTQPPRKVAWSVLACHPSPFPLDCRRCVTVPLTDHWPHWGHAGGWSNISARSVTSRREGRKTRTKSSQQWHLYRYGTLHAGRQWLLALLFLKDRMLKRLPRRQDKG